MSESKVDKVREQFDQLPYPNIAIEETPKNELNTLFKFSLTTSQYR
ncbi:hypothetical protein [Synechococcus sp. PCC 7502]|nr:hypothetical protein [Synechococcus sp. PCC 7502]